MECIDWNVEYLSIFRVLENEEGRELSLETVLSNAGFPEGDRLLQELLDRLINEAFRKRPDTGETSSCKLWAFQDTPPGREDRELLASALDASSPADFQSPCRRIGGRYAGLAGARPALLIFLKARITPSKGVGGDYFLFFVCEFEEVRRIDPAVGQVEPVEDAVMSKCRKALVYPHFNGYEHDRERVRLVQSGGKGALLSDLFYLEAPRTTRQLLEDELRELVVARPDGRKYEAYFEREAPKERELFGEERYINLTDLLQPDDVVHMSKATYQSALDKHGKKARVRIVVDEGVKFEGRLDKLGVNFFFAKKGGDKFLIVKGEKFLTKSQLSSIEFLDVEDLDDVLPRISGGD